MVPSTRRRFLHVAAAATGGLAGCGQLTGGTSRSTRSDTPAAEPADAPDDTATDPPTVLVRAGTERPPIRLADPDRENTETPDPERLASRTRYEVIGSQSRADRLTVADGVGDGDGSEDGDAGNGDADSVAAFVDETEFESETLFLHTNRVEECFRLRLCRISWRPDSIDTDYTRQLRPYDERCEADAHVYESRLIRLPVALDEDSVTSYSASVGGSGQCDPADAARADGSDSTSDAVANSGSNSGSSSGSTHERGSDDESATATGSATPDGSGNGSQRATDGGAE